MLSKRHKDKLVQLVLQIENKVFFYPILRQKFIFYTTDRQRFHGYQKKLKLSCQLMRFQDIFAAKSLRF